MTEPRKKLTPFQEGQEQTRRELWPDLPDGYRRGTIAGPSFVHISPPVCVMCGAVVGDTDQHDAFHTQLAAAAWQAEQASVMTNVIGPKASDL